jgi:hypothetical protein
MAKPRDTTPGIAGPTPNSQADYILNLLRPDAEEPEPPPPAPEPEPKPEPESCVLAEAMDDADDTVALDDPSTTARPGLILQIDNEYMTIMDASDPAELVVARGLTAIIDPHQEGAVVLIGVAL